jgi:hypothetical protein
MFLFEYVQAMDPAWSFCDAKECCYEDIFSSASLFRLIAEKSFFPSFAQLVYHFGFARCIVRTKPGSNMAGITTIDRISKNQ